MEGETADFVTEEWRRELHNNKTVRISDLKEEKGTSLECK